MKQKSIPFLGLALALTLSLLSGCGVAPVSSPSDTNMPALTMEMAVEANTAARLLEKYKTVTYAQLDYIGGNTTHMTFYKDENDFLCSVGQGFGYTDYRTDCFTFFREKGESTYFFSAMEDAYVSDYLFMVSGSTFTSQVTDVSGNLVCKTEAEISQEFAEELSEYWPATTEDKMVTTTVFAVDDFRVLSVDFTICRPDGSESKIASGVLLYDKEVTYTDAVQNYLEETKVTVTMVMEDGSIRTAQIPEGERFTWGCDDGYALYTDKDGNKPLPEETEPVKSDLIVYNLPK